MPLEKHLGLLDHQKLTEINQGLLRVKLLIHSLHNSCILLNHSPYTVTRDLSRNGGDMNVALQFELRTILNKENLHEQNPHRG